MEDCIFCKIGRGDVPATLVYSDDVVVAFDDLSPQAPVHTLIIPRAHFTGLGEAVPAETLAALLAAVKKVAEAKGIRESGYRTIINTGPDAGQTVHHLHVHVLGGTRMAEGMLPSSAD